MIVIALIFQKVLSKKKLRVMLGVLFTLGQTASAEQQITANWVETQLKASGIARTYAGAVAFTDSSRALKIFADSAFVRDTQYVFVSNLSFKDSTRQVRANMLTYDDQTREAKFSGGVVLKDGQRSLGAHTIDVMPDSENVVAQGGVVLEFEAEKRQIRAGRLTYEGIRDLGLASQSVVALLRGNNDSLFIAADSLRFSENETNFEFWGNVVVKQMETELSAQSGRYQKNQMWAYGEPKLIRVETSTGDSMWTSADTIGVSLKDEQVGAFNLSANAKIHLQNQRDTSVASYTLLGKQGNIDIVEKKISALDMQGDVKLAFAHKKTTVEMLGDSVYVFFKDGKLDSLTLLGNTEGTVELEESGSGRLMGEKRTLWFVGDVLVHMRLEGQALCTYTDLNPDGESDMNVGGDRIDLYFSKGELSSIEAVGQVQGVYVQENEGNKP